jgi:hypothetical protein
MRDGAYKPTDSRGARKSATVLVSHAIRPLGRPTGSHGRSIGGGSQKGDLLSPSRRPTRVLMPASPAPDTALNTQWHRAPSVVRSGALGSRPRKGEFPTVALTRTSPERGPGGSTAAPDHTRHARARVVPDVGPYGIIGAFGRPDPDDCGRTTARRGASAGRPPGSYRQGRVAFLRRRRRVAGPTPPS